MLMKIVGNFTNANFLVHVQITVFSSRDRLFGVTNANFPSLPTLSTHTLHLLHGPSPLLQLCPEAVDGVLLLGEVSLKGVHLLVSLSQQTSEVRDIGPHGEELTLLQ